MELSKRKHTKESTEEILIIKEEGYEINEKVEKVDIDILQKIRSEDTNDILFFYSKKFRNMVEKYYQNPHIRKIIKEMFTKESPQTLYQKTIDDTWYTIHSVYYNYVNIDLKEENKRAKSKKIRERYFRLGINPLFSMICFFQTIGDTIGFYNGNWEFNYGDPNIGSKYAMEMVYQYFDLGGISELNIKEWRASDDTILYLATLKVVGSHIKSIDDYGKRLRESYLEILPELTPDRYPGTKTIQSLSIQKHIQWDQLHYDSTAIGAGSAMRSGCIGMFYLGRHNRNKLIALAVETSRITHNSAIAILGSIVSALFTAYALESIEVNLWPSELIKLLRSDKIDNYMKISRPSEYQIFREEKAIFIGQWEKYIIQRFSGITPKKDKQLINLVTRIEYFSGNFSKGHEKNPGSCGDDAVIMAYDAVLISGGILEKLLVYSILHPGDSDTVGSIAFSWFFASYSKNIGKYYDSVKNLLENLEFKDRIDELINLSSWKIYKSFYYDLFCEYAQYYVTTYFE